MTLYVKRIIVAFTVSALCAMLCSCGNTPVESIVPTETSAPVIDNALVECTWEEFEAMSSEEQMAFQNSFSSIEAFDAWLQAAQPAQPSQPSQPPMPWDNGGKQPGDYTMEEFDALTAEEQMAFQNSFEDPDGFDEWLARVESETLEFPWDNGGKQPEDYTWEEFEALSVELQIAFQESFGGFDAFDDWMQNATYEEIPDYSESDGKDLEEHTWEDFENMTAEDQIRFQNSFGSFEAFDEWLQNAQSAAGIAP